MELELTPRQARMIARLRTRFPGSDVRAHERSWGVIVEVRRGGHAVSLTAFDGTGGVRTDAPIPLAA